MIISRREFLAGAAGSLSIQPSEGGTYPLGFETHRDGLVYVPARYRPGTAAPLLLLFHGAGGSASRASAWFPLADEYGIVMLAPDSRDGRSWDAVLGRHSRQG